MFQAKSNYPLINQVSANKERVQHMYTIPGIQNELLSIIGEYIRDSIHSMKLKMLKCLP